MLKHGLSETAAIGVSHAEGNQLSLVVSAIPAALSHTQSTHTCYLMIQFDFEWDRSLCSDT